jgi:radical SAM protein with 4Fe4S-binding SPASM domain
MEARLLNIKYDLDLPVIQNSCSAGKSLYINPSGKAFPCYMIPPIADVFPELNKYMTSWDILTEPISKAEEAFESFIKMARAHTQINHESCADCSEQADCSPCPLIANYDETSLARCKIAQRMAKQLIANINNSTIPKIRERIEWNISVSIIGYLGQSKRHTYYQRNNR